MVVAVGLMDGRSISLHVDSASTSREVCDAIIQKVHLKDTYGFSLYAAINEKVCIILMPSKSSFTYHVVACIVARVIC